MYVFKNKHNPILTWVRVSNRARISFITLLIFDIFIHYSCVSPTRGNYYFKLQDYDQAIAEYNIVLASNPDSFTANLRMGDIYFSRAEYYKSKSFYVRAFNLKPGNIEAKEKLEKIDKVFDKLDGLKHQGDDFFNLRNFVKAEIVYNDIIDLFPDYKGIKEKIDECKKMINDASLIYAEGLKFEQAKELKKSLASFKKALESTPFNQEYKDKIDAVQKEINIVRDDIYKALNFTKSREFDKAIKILDRINSDTGYSDEIDYYFVEIYKALANKNSNMNEKLKYLKKASEKSKSITDGNQFNDLEVIDCQINAEIELIEVNIKSKKEKADQLMLEKKFIEAANLYNDISTKTKESSSSIDSAKLEIKCRIENIFSKKYMPLPELELTYNLSIFDSTVIAVINNTSYPLNFFYYGDEAGSVEIKPGKIIDVKFPPGKYKLAAILNTGKLFYFAGEKQLNIGKFELLFYEEKKQ
jgi:tetratricopeptide (TPR) repeat protein